MWRALPAKKKRQASVIVIKGPTFFLDTKKPQKNLNLTLIIFFQQVFKNSLQFPKKLKKYFEGPLKKVHYIRSIILSNFLRKCLSYRRSKIDIFRPRNSVILYCMTKFLNHCHGEELLHVNNFCSVCVNKIYTSKTLVKNKDLNSNLTFQTSHFLDIV